MSERGYCIFINTVFEGPVPAVRENSADDPAGSPGRVCVFGTEREAQVEIVENMMVRLREFIDGERDFDDAVTLEEYVVEVDVFPDGTMVDADGNEFSAGDEID